MNDEGAQAHCGVRTADRYDLMADANGTIIGTPIIALSLSPAGIFFIA